MLDMGMPRTVFRFGKDNGVLMMWQTWLCYVVMTPFLFCETLRSQYE